MTPAPRTTDDQPCPFGLCDGSGFVVDEATRSATTCRCRPSRLERRRARRLSAVIKPKYRGVSFDRPPISDIHDVILRPVRQFVRRIDEELDAGHGFWWYGKPGTGKTSLAMLVSKAALDAGRSVAIYSLPRLLAEIRSTFEADSGGSYLDFVDRLAAVDLLHIDDVGAENTTPWVLEQLYTIVNARYEEERSILITTNIDEPDQLATQIGKRTVSRLEEMCTVLPLFGDDARELDDRKFVA
jgi:DNA replication protein DnaC